MFVSQKLKSWLPIFVISKIFSLASAQTTNSSGSIMDQICDSLKHGQGAKSNVLSVGLTKNNLLLVTSDFYVYDIPASSMDHAINTLYLTTKPTPMSEKYPELWNNSRFKAIKDGLIFNSFVMIDASQSAYLCMTTKASMTQASGINYNLADSRIFTGWSFRENVKEVLISTPEIGSFYSISLSDKYGSENIKASKDALKPNIPIDQNPRISSDDNWKIICWKNSDKKEIVFQKEDCKSPKQSVQWSVYKGFVQDRKFYLFGDTSIIIFNENVFEDGKPSPVIEKPYDSFFWCPTTIQSSRAEDYMWLIIVLIILLLVLLCMVLFCAVWVVQPKKGKRRRKFKLNPSTTISMRSQSSALFGMLTKLNTQVKSNFKARSTNQTPRSKDRPKSMGVLSRKNTSGASLGQKSRKKPRKNLSKPKQSMPEFKSLYNNY